jgi:two-component system, OmpR family, response regulator ChvI
MDSLTATRKILFVDDEEDIIFLIHEGLKRNGFEADAFTDPVLALTSYKANFYDLIILDIKMPVMDGFEFYQNIRKQDKTVKVCFLSALEKPDEELLTYNEFSNFEKPYFVQKPVRIVDLVKKINEILSC